MGTRRRGGDSNPRYPLGVQRLSRAPDSATLAPLPFQSPPSPPANPPPAPWGAASRPLLALSESRGPARFPGSKGRGKSDRRGRDSNPRNRKAAQRFSRPPPSTTRTPLPRTWKRHGLPSNSPTTVCRATLTFFWQGTLYLPVRALSTKRRNRVRHPYGGRRAVGRGVRRR